MASTNLLASRKPLEPISSLVAGVREVLQAVEDTLTDAGYDDFMVATERGSFHWMTVERARARAAEDD